jgi:catechol 2,3-dioxygenase-like lactoylglutathione lyase family enzyme
VTNWDWSRIVLDHVKIGAQDAAASKRFYGTVLAPLRIPPLWESDQGAQYANLVVSGKAATAAPLHIAFVARSREEVDAFHRAGIEAGFATSTAQRRRGSTMQPSCSTRTAITSKPSIASSPDSPGGADHRRLGQRAGMSPDD